ACRRGLGRRARTAARGAQPRPPEPHPTGRLTPRRSPTPPVPGPFQRPPCRRPRPRGTILLRPARRVTMRRALPLIAVLLTAFAPAPFPRPERKRADEGVLPRGAYVVTAHRYAGRNEL